jgi:hypothetical protein
MGHGAICTECYQPHLTIDQLSNPVKQFIRPFPVKKKNHKPFIMLLQKIDGRDTYGERGDILGIG